MITRQEAYKLYREFVNVFEERANELRFICSKHGFSLQKEFDIFGNTGIGEIGKKQLEWEESFKSHLMKVVEDKGYWLEVCGDVNCTYQIILPSQLDGETFEDVLHNVAKDALGWTPYSVSFENGLTDEAFDYMWDETDHWVIEHKLSRAIELMNYTIERAGIEELHALLLSEILKSMNDCANYMRDIYEEYYNEALRNLTRANQSHYDVNGVIRDYREQLQRGNFDDWYKLHLDNQVCLIDIVEINDELRRLIDESKK